MQIKPKILVISSSFPPKSYTGSRRVEAFVRHMYDYGFDPKVVSLECHPRYTSLYDKESFLDSHRKAVLMLTPSFEVYNKPKYLKVVLLVRGIFISPLSVLITILKHPFKKLNDLTPVSLWVYGRRVLKELKKDEEGYKAIYATTPSNATLMLANYLSKKSGVPFYADLRDDYAELLSEQPLIKDAIVRREKNLLKNAAKVITVSKGCAAQISRRIDREVSVIHNGYDSVTFNKINTLEKSNKFIIRYTGSLGTIKKKRVDAFFQGLHSLVSAGVYSESKQQVEFYIPQCEHALLSRLVEKYQSIESLVKIMDPVCWVDSVALQKSANLLLFLPHSEMKGILTTKIYEYMSTSNPILSVFGDNDDADEVLRCYGNASICYTHEQVVESLTSIAYSKDISFGTTNHDFVSKFDRKYLTKKLLIEMGVL